MKQHYFVYKDVKYYSGTEILIKQNDVITGRLCNKKATFLYHNTEWNTYAFKINGHTCVYPQKDFFNVFVGVTDCITHEQDATDIMNRHVCIQNHNKYTLSKELNIDGLFIAWTWYIFIMLAAIFFNARIGIWLLASVIFFNYRNKKLKEAGLKK